MSTLKCIFLVLTFQSLLIKMTLFDFYQPLLQRDVHQRRGGGETSADLPSEHQCKNAQKHSRFRLLGRDMH